MTTPTIDELSRRLVAVESKTNILAATQTEIKKTLSGFDEEFAKFKAGVGKTVDDIDPESVPVTDNPIVWGGGAESLTHGLCKKHKECTLVRWRSAEGDSRGPVL